MKKETRKVIASISTILCFASLVGIVGVAAETAPSTLTTDKMTISSDRSEEDISEIIKEKLVWMPEELAEADAVEATQMANAQQKLAEQRVLEKERKEKAAAEKAKRIAAEEAKRIAAEEAAIAEAARIAAEEEAARVAAEAAEVAAQEQQAVNSPVMGASPSDLNLLAAIIHCEAGGEPYEGQVAVGAVILNRVRSGVYPGSISEVIYQPGQFGPAMTGLLDSVLASGSVYESCYQAASDALAGANPIGEALYFGNGDYGQLIGGHWFH